MRNVIIIILLALLNSCLRADLLNQKSQENEFMDVELTNNEQKLYKEAIAFYNNKQYILAFYRFMHIRDYLDTNTYMKLIYKKISRVTLKVYADHVKYLDDDGNEKVIFYHEPEIIIETGNKYYSYTNTELYSTAIKMNHTLELNGIIPDGMYYYLDPKEKLNIISNWNNVYNFQANEFACFLDDNGSVDDTYSAFRSEKFSVEGLVVQIYCDKLEYRILLTEDGRAFKQYTEIGVAAEGKEIHVYFNIALLPTRNEPYGIDNEGNLVYFETLVSPTSKVIGDYKNLAWIFQTEKYSNYLVLMDGNGMLFMPGADDEFNKVLGSVTDVIEVNYSDLFNVVVKTRDGSLLQVRKGYPTKIVEIKGPDI